MQEKMYAFVGNWGFAPAPKGISTFQYDPETGDMKLIETIHQEIAAGQLFLDEENMILYAVDECGERKGEIGGGGYVLSFRIDPNTGKLTKLNQQESLLAEPSYLEMTKSKKYLMTCHCADPFHVTKVVANDDGTFSNEVVFDDTALVLFPINEDGSIAPPCDVAITHSKCRVEGESKRNVDPVTKHIQLVRIISRLHAVIGSPDGSIFVACDKGMDKLYTFRIDEEKGKFVMLDEYMTEEVASFPRYGAFHPTLPIFYANNENLALLNCFKYDENGKLSLHAKLKLLEEDPGLVEGKPVGAQDIMVHPNGKTLYVTLCGINEIIVVDLDDEGKPSLRQSVHSNGNLPRGVCLSPDGRYLLSGNMVSKDITTFEVQEDGSLNWTGKIHEAVSPSAIKILTIK